MTMLLDYPLAVFAISLATLAVSVWFGAAAIKRWRPLRDDAREDFGVILAATLTLLGLIIGFTFSMAISRYDQRKIYEEEEANAIGTEYVRADLLPASNAAVVRTLLRDYVDQRILFYRTRDADELARVNLAVAQLQGRLWSAVSVAAQAQPTPIVALAVSGMNDVLNTQGYTQAAWWNRIPIAAWALMWLIALCCNVLMGYGARSEKAETALLLVLPAIVSVSFLLIADIDSPRGGVIRVRPQNLLLLEQSLPPR
jgi:hypothetical protein